MNYIKNQWQLFNFDNVPEVCLKHTKTHNMQSGHVVRHRQYYRGLRVDKNEITIKIDRNDRIRIVLNNTFPINQKIGIKPEIDKAKAFDIVQEHLGIEGKLRHRSVELMIHVQEQIPRLSYKVNVIAARPTGDWEAYVDARTGEVLQANDIAMYCFSGGHKTLNHNKDEVTPALSNAFAQPKVSVTPLRSSTEDTCTSPSLADGTGYVYNPNPVVSAMTEYGTGDFVDNENATNSTLKAERMLVTLRDIEYCSETGLYKLKGPNASIVDINGAGAELYEQDNASFQYDRSQQAFEAANCYYHIDRSMRYVKDVLGVVVTLQYEGGVQFDPHYPTPTGGIFMPDVGQIGFTDSFLLDPIVDNAEDALLVYHELGHAYHHWQSDQNLSSADGLSEGLADYWGQSSTRPCNHTGLWDEWENNYHKILHWAGLPTAEYFQRYTNFNSAYEAFDLVAHQQGQHISTALMRIRDDLGREKTDLLVLESMVMLTKQLPSPPGMSQQEAADIIYQIAVDLEYTTDDLCILYQHLDDKFDISTSAPSGGTGDIYIQDTKCDIGDEPNLNSMVWGSRDIWVRNTNDGLLEHQNPDYSQNPNYVYVRIRGNGCLPVTDASLSVHFSKASTSLQWPAKWVNYYVTGPGGPVLAGDLIETTGIEEIKPGHEQIIEIEWNVPNPDDFRTRNHYYCLLARIVSASDPMYHHEGSDIMRNAQNNNVALTNMSLMPWVGLPVKPVPISVYLGCDPKYGNGKISISSAIHPLNKSIFDYGDIYIELMEPLKSNWVANGKQGRAFELKTDGRIKVKSETFKLDDLLMSNCENLVIEVTFEPFLGAKVCAFDVIQHDSQGEITGGERFEYRPQIGQPQAPAFIQIEPSGTANPNNQIEVFPNPVNNEVNIRLNQIVEGKVYVELYSTSGKLLSNTYFESVNALTNTVSVAHLSDGMYILHIYNDLRDIDASFKLIKQ